MATAPNQNDKSQVASTPNSGDWLSLISKTIEDLTELAGIQLKLHENALAQTIEGQITRAIGVLLEFVLLMFGLGLVVSAVILILHKWIEWWAALLMTASIVLSVALAIRKIIDERLSAES